MSSEALRLTSRAPAELLHVLGPQGVEELIHQARGDCWREYPAEGRSVGAVAKALREVFDRNLKVWRAIKKPSPAAFFDNLLPHAADGHIRQALVLCHMMLPRGQKSVAAAADVVRSIFDRMMAGWEEDEGVFTKGKARKHKKLIARGKKAKGRGSR